MVTLVAAEKVAKAVCSMSLAVLVRAVRFGIADALPKLTVSYRLVNPFESKRSLLNMIPHVNLADVVGMFSTVVLDSADGEIDGALPRHELIALLAILCDRRPAVVLEIGTFFGTTTTAIALNSPASVVHTIDLPPDYKRSTVDDVMPKDDFHLIQGRKVGAAFASRPAIGNIRQHFGDTAAWDFAEAEGPSFIFIDGSHTYAYARNDTLKSVRASTKPATLVWHDCSDDHPGVVQWLAELVRAGLPVVRIRRTTLAMMDVREDLMDRFNSLG